MNTVIRGNFGRILKKIVNLYEGATDVGEKKAIRDVMHSYGWYLLGTKNPDQDFEIIALAFEKYRDESKAMNTIKRYKDRLEIPYEILLAGYYDKSEATQNLGFIDEVISYPTLLFVTGDNRVLKVHTGFSGPATSAFSEFNESFIRDLGVLLSSKL